MGDVQLVAGWLMEYACVHRMTSVVRAFSKVGADSTGAEGGGGIWQELLSKSSGPVPARMMLLTIETVMQQSDEDQYETIITLIDHLFSSAAQHIPFKVYLKCTTGLKILTVFHHLQTKSKKVLALLNQYFPANNGSFHPNTPQHTIKKMEDAQQRFRKFFLPLIADSDARRKYMRETYEEDFGSRFMLILKKHVRDLISHLERLLPMPVLMKLLTNHDVLRRLSRTGSPALATLAEGLEGRSELTDRTVLQLLHKVLNPATQSSGSSQSKEQDWSLELLTSSEVSNSSDITKEYQEVATTLVSVSVKQPKEVVQEATPAAVEPGPVVEDPYAGSTTDECDEQVTQISTSELRREVKRQHENTDQILSRKEEQLMVDDEKEPMEKETAGEKAASEEKRVSKEKTTSEEKAASDVNKAVENISTVKGMVGEDEEKGVNEENDVVEDNRVQEVKMVDRKKRTSKESGVEEQNARNEEKDAAEEGFSLALSPTEDGSDKDVFSPSPQPLHPKRILSSIRKKGSRSFIRPNVIDGSSPNQVQHSPTEQKTTPVKRSSIVNSRPVKGLSSNSEASASPTTRLGGVVETSPAKALQASSQKPLTGPVKDIANPVKDIASPNNHIASLAKGLNDLDVEPANGQEKRHGSSTKQRASSPKEHTNPVKRDGSPTEVCISPAKGLVRNLNKELSSVAARHDRSAKVQSSTAKRQKRSAKIESSPAQVQASPANGQNGFTKTQSSPGKIKTSPSKVQNSPAKVQNRSAKAQYCPSTMTPEPTSIQTRPAKSIQSPAIQSPQENSPIHQPSSHGIHSAGTIMEPHGSAEQCASSVKKEVSPAKIQESPATRLRKLLHIDFANVEPIPTKRRRSLEKEPTSSTKAITAEQISASSPKSQFGSNIKVSSPLIREMLQTSSRVMPSSSPSILSLSGHSSTVKEHSNPAEQSAKPAKKEASPPKIEASPATRLHKLLHIDFAHVEKSPTNRLRSHEKEPTDSPKNATDKQVTVNPPKRRFDGNIKVSNPLIRKMLQTSSPGMPSAFTSMSLSGNSSTVKEHSNPAERNASCAEKPPSPPKIEASPATRLRKLLYIDFANQEDSPTKRLRSLERGSTISANDVTDKQATVCARKKGRSAGNIEVSSSSVGEMLQPSPGAMPSPTTSVLSPPQGSRRSSSSVKQSGDEESFLSSISSFKSCTEEHESDDDWQSCEEGGANTQSGYKATARSPISEPEVADSSHGFSPGSVTIEEGNGIRRSTRQIVTVRRSLQEVTRPCCVKLYRKHYNTFGQVFM